MVEIKNEEDYKRALVWLEVIFNADKSSSDSTELEVLGALIDDYENEHYPIGFPNPAEALAFRMDQMGNQL